MDRIVRLCLTLAVTAIVGVSGASCLDQQAAQAKTVKAELLPSPPSAIVEPADSGPAKPPCPEPEPQTPRPFQMKTSLMTIGEHQYVAYVVAARGYGVNGGLVHHVGCPCLASPKPPVAPPAPACPPTCPPAKAAAKPRPAILPAVVPRKPNVKFDCPACRKKLVR